MYLYDKILFFEPYFTENIWGGSRLKTEFGYELPDGKIGECWAFSAFPGMESKVKNGKYAGRTLGSLWKGNPELFGTVHTEDFPVLTKLIAAEDDLSIQVHPDNEYAFRNENGSLGKKESWYILDCPAHAELVIGHNAQTKEELVGMVKEGHWKEMIRKMPISKGDFIQIDPGTVHAITAGVLLLEIQQSSNITYRLYDYDRLSNGKPRELHIEKSLDVITVPAQKAEDMVLHTAGFEANKLQVIAANECYTVFKLEVVGKAEYEKTHKYDLVTVVQGSCIINDVPVKKGDHFLIPAGVEEIHVRGNAEFIITTY